VHRSTYIEQQSKPEREEKKMAESHQQPSSSAAAAPVAVVLPHALQDLTLLRVLEQVQDVTKYLMQFLSPKEQRTLLNTSRRLTDMKKHLLYWKLTKTLSP
jgi:hypothetical protein